MSPLLAPVFAQLVTLGLSDRTEARYIVSEDDKRLEGSTSPAVGLSVAWRRVGVAAAYTPYVTVSPLDSEPREVTLFHNAAAGVDYRYQFQRTTISFSESVSYGQHNYRAELLGPRTAQPPTGPGGAASPPATPGGTPGGTGTNTGTNTGTGNDPSAPGGTAGETPSRATAREKTVRIGSSTTTIAMSRGLTRRTSLAASTSYVVTGGLDDSSRADYPIVHGPQGNVGVSHRLSRQDDASASLSTQYAFVHDGTRAWVTSASAGYTRSFTPRTSAHVDAGGSVAWTHQVDGTDAVSIYPGFGAGIGHTRRAGRGTLSLSADASAAPVLDMTNGTVDPRLGVGGAFGWTRRPITVSLSISSAVSLDGDSEDAFNSIGANASIAYDIGAGFSADAGIRGAWQSFGGAEILPPTWAAFVGVSWAAPLPLN
jgi:hypothetical protein